MSRPAGDLLPVLLTGLLGLLCFGIVLIVPAVRGRDTKVVCPDCGLTYRGRDKRCPYCELGWCPACGATIPLDAPMCPYCGSAEPAHFRSP